MQIKTQNIIRAAHGVDPKEYRQHMAGVFFDFIPATNKLNIVGTDAQIMVITTAKITDPADIEFCKAHFTGDGRHAYRVPGDLLKSKNLTLDITPDGDNLRAGDYILTACDGAYPNYETCIPTRDLVPVTWYVTLDLDLLKRANKAARIYKGHTITDIRPESNKDGNDLSPLVWWLDDCIIVLMPRRGNWHR